MGNSQPVSSAGNIPSSGGVPVPPPKVSFLGRVWGMITAVPAELREEARNVKAVAMRALQCLGVISKKTEAPGTSKAQIPGEGGRKVGARVAGQEAVVPKEPPKFTAAVQKKAIEISKHVRDANWDLVNLPPDLESALTKGSDKNVTDIFDALCEAEREGVHNSVTDQRVKENKDIFLRFVASQGREEIKKALAQKLNEDSNRGYFFKFQVDYKDSFNLLWKSLALQVPQASGRESPKGASSVEREAATPLQESRAQPLSQTEREGAEYEVMNPNLESPWIEKGVPERVAAVIQKGSPNEVVALFVRFSDMENALGPNPILLENKDAFVKAVALSPREEIKKALKLKLLDEPGQKFLVAFKSNNPALYEELFKTVRYVS